MPVKNFEQVVRFCKVPQGPGGPFIWLPLVNVTFATPANGRVILPLLFDTGASVTTLIKDLYPLLGLQSWDQGIKVETDTAGGKMTVYQYTCTIEVFGKTIDCPIHLSLQMPDNPLFVGLLGRNTVYNEFGFGFWESTHELYITANP